MEMNRWIEAPKEILGRLFLGGLLIMLLIVICSSKPESLIPLGIFIAAVTLCLFGILIDEHSGCS